MYDHDAWRRFSVKHGASEHIWDQCLKADDPASVAVKSSVWLATPNISSIVVEEFGEPPRSLCNHPEGTHKALRGADSSGRYVTVTQRSENHSGGTNLSIARCI